MKKKQVYLLISFFISLIGIIILFSYNLVLGIIITVISCFGCCLSCASDKIVVNQSLNSIDSSMKSASRSLPTEMTKQEENNFVYPMKVKDSKV